MKVYLKPVEHKRGVLGKGGSEEGNGNRKWGTSWSGLSAWGTFCSQMLSLRNKTVDLQKGFEVSHVQEFSRSPLPPYTHYKWTTSYLVCSLGWWWRGRATCETSTFRRPQIWLFSLSLSKWACTYDHRDSLIRLDSKKMSLFL